MADDVVVAPVFGTLPMLTFSCDGQGWPVPVPIEAKNSATGLI